MISFGRTIKTLSLLLILTAAGCAGQKTADRSPSGTYTVSFDNAGLVIGFHTGQGKLVLNDGSEYAFTADGYSIADLGYSVATATGAVYNLSKPGDIEGEYRAVGAVAILGKGSGGAGLKNRTNDVILDVDSAETGLRFGLGGGYVTVKLGKMLKGPRVAAVKPAPVKPAPVMAPKPVTRNIEFGYDKSRVSIAIGKQLDPIAAEWRNKPASFVVVGHADTVGTDAYNMNLSSMRAENVKKALIARGIEAARISARGVGEKGLAVQTPEETRLRANRRVSITISIAR
ncbi:MAG: OmpA family protein [Rhodospirillaceae bacterium]|nr:OmpA family protein [Rhodospirillaceae bacterium]